MKTKLLLLHFILPLFAFAQITQIGADIDGEAAGDESGRSVSISADGSTVAIELPTTMEMVSPLVTYVSIKIQGVPGCK